MFHNGADCMSGVLVFQDVVQTPEIQSHKDFFNEASHLPGNPPITAHAAEVLHQLKGQTSPLEAGLVGMHGSEVSCQLLKSRCISISSQHGLLNRKQFFSPCRHCTVS